jgi:hypothetical protein
VSVKHIEPQLGLESFSCPHCGAISHQTWFRGLLIGFERGSKPMVVGYDAVLHARLAQHNAQDPAAEKERERKQKFFERLAKHTLTYKLHRHSQVSEAELVNLSLSQCYSCDGFAVWLEDRLLYPDVETKVAPHEEMPDTIKQEFEEAASIVDKSPRGATALLIPILHQSELTI